MDEGKNLISSPKAKYPDPSNIISLNSIIVLATFFLKDKKNIEVEFFKY